MKDNQPLFRSVKIPEYGSDKLFLYSLPGVNEPIEDFLLEMNRIGIKRVVCLVPRSEIEVNSPSYAVLMKKKAYSWEQIMFGISDWGIPYNQDDFLSLAIETAKLLFNADPPVKTLIHCYAGIGRTGTFSITVLMAGGIPLKIADSVIRASGSKPESNAQIRLIQWCEKELIKDGKLPLPDDIMN